MNSQNASSLPLAGPAIGAHTAEILREIGIDEQSIRQFVAGPRPASTTGSIHD